jgi:transketolase
MGPVLQGLYELNDPGLLEELEIWAVGTFPLHQPPVELAQSIKQKSRVVTIEEHYGPGGLGEALGHLLLTTGTAPRTFSSLSVAGYPSGRHGSQLWHQCENGLRGPELAARLEKLVRG